MKVSILLTSYNLVDYIDASIQSVVQMDMPFEWELLIGDDGSTDGTVEKINTWIEKYPNNIRLYCIERSDTSVKIGSRAAQNRALLLEKAQGDYINYLDGDDCFLGSEKIKEQVSLLDNPNNTDCSCCAHNSKVIRYPEGKRFLLSEPRKNGKMTIKDYWPYYYFHTNTLMFRKECKQLLLNSMYRGFLNDNFITYLVLQQGNMLYLEKVWAQYNQTGTGLWTGHSRVYGTFRNMQIFDLELYANPKLSKQIYLRHQGDIRFINSNSTPETLAEIQPLLNNTDPEIFKYTFLFSNILHLNSTEKKQYRKVLRKANFAHLVFKCHRAILKIRRIVLHR